MARATATATERITYTLTLDEDEAAALLAVARFVGGDDQKTPRRHIDAIGATLLLAGAKPYRGGLSGSGVKFEEEFYAAFD